MKTLARAVLLFLVVGGLALWGWARFVSGSAEELVDLLSRAASTLPAEANVVGCDLFHD